MIAVVKAVTGSKEVESKTIYNLVKGACSMQLFAEQNIDKKENGCCYEDVKQIQRMAQLAQRLQAMPLPVVAKTVIQLPEFADSASNCLL